MWFWDCLFRNEELVRNGENDCQRTPSSPPSSGVSFLVSGSRSAHSSDTQSLYFWAMPTLGPHVLPPSPSPPASLLCSALRTFSLCSKKPLYRSLCLPGVPYFISFLWGIPLTLQDQLKCQLLKGFPWLSGQREFIPLLRCCTELCLGTLQSHYLGFNLGSTIR